MYAFDFSHTPFSYLTPAERTLLQESADIVFLNDHETVIQPDQSIGHLYVVIKGLVKECGADGEVLALYQPHDVFETRALLQGSSPNRFAVQEQALLYQIPKETVLQIIALNPRFAAYCYASAADKLASLAHGKHESEFASLFTARVRDAYRGDPTWLDDGTTAFQAASVLKERKTKSALVRHEGKVGVFTESAFRDMLIAGLPPDTPVGELAVYQLISADIDDFVFNALLTMMRHRIQRVVVEEHGQPVGTLEQIDVLAYFSNHSHLAAQRIERAGSIDELADISAQMTDSVRLLRGNGVRAPQLAELMQVLNSALFEKVWRLTAPTDLYAQSCLIVMGSEGRGEQILKTDQDNALILHEQADPAAAAEAAEAFSATLARLGYPPCKGRIMVNNPEWRKTLSEFKQMVFDWCRTRDGDAMMKLAIFTDAKAVAGDDSLLADVRAHLRKYMQQDAGMMMTFAAAVEQFDSQHKGFFAQLLTRGGEKLDIKKVGQFPIVHGVRALSLEKRLDETNTFDRIRALVRLGTLEPAFGQDLSEALSYLMDLRLQANLDRLLLPDGGEPNQLDFKSVSTLERDLLKDALQVVKRFKGIIRHHFHLQS